MQQIGKLLVITGIILVFIGVIFLVISKLGLPLGNLPGDMTYHRKNMTVYVPIGTMILISVVLSVILNIFTRWKH